MAARIGFLFPAFGTGYSGGSGELFPGYEEELGRLLPRAAAVVEIDRRRFDEPADDLQAHYVCYINSCLIADAFTRLGTTCRYVAPARQGRQGSANASGRRSLRGALSPRGGRRRHSESMDPNPRPSRLISELAETGPNPSSGPADEPPAEGRSGR